MKRREFLGVVVGTSLISGVPFILSEPRKLRTGSILDRVQVFLYPEEILKKFQRILRVSREGQEFWMDTTRLISVERKITEKTARIEWKFEDIVFQEQITVLEKCILDHRGNPIWREQMYLEVCPKDVYHLNYALSCP